MGIEIRPDYSKTYLLPPSLDDWVGADHPSRFIRDFVDSLDLKQLGFRIPEAVDGRPPYSVDLLLKVWLYGYTNRLRSSRKLERACREHMSLIWLTGNNHPDHNTLWRFWSVNKKALRKVFRQSVLTAHRSNLIGFVLHAVDGTKIKADVSKWTGWHRDNLEKLLAAVETSIDQMMDQVSQAEQTEQGDYSLPEELRDAQSRRDKIKEALAELNAIDRAHLHPQDRDARMMKGNGKVEFGFNAQAIVDSKNGLLVGEGVTNDETDREQLVSMIEAVQDNLGLAAEETIADGGYYLPSQIAEAEKKGLGVLVPLPEATDNRWGKEEFKRANFVYDETGDVFICPLGNHLSYERTKLNRQRKYSVRIYRCHCFRECPVRHQCSRDKRGRYIEKGECYKEVERQRAKQRDINKRKLMRKRAGMIELVFAQIKEHHSFRRWTVRGLEKVRTQWSLTCTAFNLKKLYKYWLAGALVI